MGVWFSTCIRLELQAPGNQFLGGAIHYYNTVVTMHGVIMIFFVVMPIFMGGFGNVMVPLQCGTSEMMYPRANNFAF